ncbi:kidins220, partial [Symbiodinium sp. CCMP2456]
AFSKNHETVIPTRPMADAKRVAVIGGGISGAVCASTLCRNTSSEVTVFDQGRQLGGRCGHRRVAADGTYPAPVDASAFAFDHGCQFFRADDPRFRSELLEKWKGRGLVEEWVGNFGKLGQEDESSKADFFGFPDRPPFYCALGGMSSLPAALLEEATSLGATLRGGVRVASTQRLSSGAWLLRGVEGPAALHDTAEEEAAKQAPDALGEFDVVIVTDVSASMASWHRASAGLPESLAGKVRSRTRVALFTALVAFEAPLQVESDAFAA